MNTVLNCIPAVMCIILSLLCINISAQAAESPVEFEKTTLHEVYIAEGINYADFNQDGNMDIVSGPYWHEGPDFLTRHEYYPFQPENIETGEPLDEWDPAWSSTNWAFYVYDFNQDGWPDVLRMSYPGREAYWYQNPQVHNGDFWPEHLIYPVVDIEGVTFEDITGDGRPELICATSEDRENTGFLGYIEPDWNNITAEWTFHRISSQGPWHKWWHGTGNGDLNGDGKEDFLESCGWWEQPASLENDPIWTYHPVDFEGEMGPHEGGAQMYAYDVDDDGDNDVIPTLESHGWGLAWFENIKQNGETTFQRHTIMGTDQEISTYGLAFSQLHALVLEDLDGDGLKDLVTGKTYWAHPPGKGDPDTEGAPVLYWFKLQRSADGIQFIPYEIDNNSGIGRQFAVGDLNGDNVPDIMTANKKGLYVFLQIGGTARITHKTKDDAFNHAKVNVHSILNRSIYTVPSGSQNPLSSATLRTLDGKAIITIPNYTPILQDQKDFLRRHISPGIYLLDY